MRSAGIPRGVRVLKGVLAGGLLLALGTLAVVPPGKLPLPPCAFYEWTGHGCLTCGMTRSLGALARGEWIAAIQYHLMGPLVLIGMVLALAALSFEAIGGRAFRWPVSRRAGKRLLWAIAAVWLLYWVARLTGTVTTVP
ncbi:MAG: DUF2752 domain-containing protein [Acidobacteria bacterium]|nr:DUF2752 domain-containing protein [Acidobacteriota bacterium]